MYIKHNDVTASPEVHHPYVWVGVCSQGPHTCIFDRNIQYQNVYR